MIMMLIIITMKLLSDKILFDKVLYVPVPDPMAPRKSANTVNKPVEKDRWWRYRLIIIEMIIVIHTP